VTLHRDHRSPDAHLLKQRGVEHHQVVAVAYLLLQGLSREAHSVDHRAGPGFHPAEGARGIGFVANPEGVQGAKQVGAQCQVAHGQYSRTAGFGEGTVYFRP
jgi:hypothetical protein